jgi:4'-phosphopantetheinyl transferase
MEGLIGDAARGRMQQRRGQRLALRERDVVEERRAGVVGDGREGPAFEHGRGGTAQDEALERRAEQGEALDADDHARVRGAEPGQRRGRGRGPRQPRRRGAGVGLGARGEQGAREGVDVLGRAVEDEAVVVHAIQDPVRARATARSTQNRHEACAGSPQAGTVSCVRAGEDRAVAWPALGPRGCQVVWARPVMPPDAALDDGVRERLAALAREEDRRRHATGAVLSDALVRIHAGAHARVVRRRGAAPRVVVGGAMAPGAAPRVEGGGSEVYMSVAHGGAWVVVAVCAAGPVGVDVEPRGRAFDAGLAEQVLAPAEREAVGAGEGLLVAWTRKEAVVKATGDGFGRVDPREVVLAPPGEPPRLLAYGGRPELAGAVAIADVAPDAEHVGAVAVLAPEPVTLAVLDGAALLGAGAATR